MSSAGSTRTLASIARHELRKLPDDLVMSALRAELSSTPKPATGTLSCRPRTSTAEGLPPELSDPDIGAQARRQVCGGSQWPGGSGRQPRPQLVQLEDGWSGVKASRTRCSDRWSV